MRLFFGFVRIFWSVFWVATLQQAPHDLLELYQTIKSIGAHSLGDAGFTRGYEPSMLNQRGSPIEKHAIGEHL